MITYVKPSLLTQFFLCLNLTIDRHQDVVNFMELLRVVLVNLIADLVPENILFDINAPLFLQTVEHSQTVFQEIFLELFLFGALFLGFLLEILRLLEGRRQWNI